MNATPIAEALEAGLTLPASWYSDPEIARLEHERIFRGAWQYVGRTDQVEVRGSYFASRAGDVPIVVTRDGDGALRAFVNVCRHRGHEVARGEGRRGALQCPYHAWTYALDGSLRSAPRAEQERGFDRRDLSLLPACVETWGPFVFVNPDRDAAPLAETLRDLPEIVAESGVDLDAVRFCERHAWEVDANWKVVVENFLECYHCPVAHHSFASVVDVGPDAYRLEVHDSFSSQFGEVRASARERRSDELPYDPRGEASAGQFHFLWPNFGLNIMPGRANVSAGPVLPAGPERTARFLDYFFGDDVPESWAREMIAFDEQVGR
ncbi:MAG: aromatic ring-hydroxylating dioxygenase subunit alpha, partial [Actinomycetota bacterium]|nr:aromatic ring-hydroxylating dioxygenase subunit alpha [Actinomycetota bacterium]